MSDYVIDGVPVPPADKVDIRPRGDHTAQVWDQDWNNLARDVIDLRAYVYDKLLAGRKVVYVDDFVTTPSNATAGVAAALAVLAASGGGMLVWGAKTYVMTNVSPGTGLVVPANVTFVGVAGYFHTTIVRDGTTAYMFNVGAGGFRTTGITYDLATVTNFPVAIWGNEADNTTVEGNRFLSSNLPNANDTMMAVLLSGSNVRVERNRSKWCQFKCDTGVAGPGLWIRGNYCESPYNMGISCVTFGGPSAALMTDVWVDDNYVINPQGASIYLGCDDNTNAAGDSHRWHARGNKCINSPLAGIYCRPGSSPGGSWDISDNMCDGGSSFASNSRGIAFEGAANGNGGLVADIVIARNIIRNTDIEGVRVTGQSVDGLKILQNILRDTRGILVADGAAGRYVRNAKVHGNDVYGKIYGCHVQAYAEVDVDFRDNDFSNESRGQFETSYGIHVEALAAAAMKVRAAFNRAGDFRVGPTDRQSFGIKETDFSGATWNSRYEYNDVRACNTPMAVLGGAVQVGNIIV